MLLMCNIFQLKLQGDFIQRIFISKHHKMKKKKKKKKESTKAVSPQQFPLPEDWVVDRVKRLQADVQILNSHVGQLLRMGLLDSCNHRLET